MSAPPSSKSNTSHTTVDGQRASPGYVLHVPAEARLLLLLLLLLPAAASVESLLLVANPNTEMLDSWRAVRFARTSSVS